MFQTFESGGQPADSPARLARLREVMAEAGVDSPAQGTIEVVAPRRRLG